VGAATPGTVRESRRLGGMTIRVGVISDTHGLLRPEAVDALLGVDRIVHAGDVGRAEILAELARLAPLTVIRGNIDHGDWADALPETTQLSVGAVTLHVLHDLAGLAIDPVVARVDIVISGHSHQPKVERRGRVLYLNPGSAGPRRFSLPITIAILTIDARHVDAEIVPLTMAGASLHRE
jgi:uncharacterized protein